MNHPIDRFSRRAFGQGLAAMTAASYSRVLGANERIHVGYIGLGNRGDQVHDAFLEHGDQETVAVCDLREDYLDLAVKKSRATPKRYSDYRQVLDDKGVDAVVIATPDHWHAIMFIEACRAGKDVYVEKPLSLTVSEGRRMVQVAAETKRVTQVGTNRRSWKSYFEAAEFIRGGGLGKVSLARAFSIRNEWPLGLGSSQYEKPMTAEQWDKWLGPAPAVPFDPNRGFYNFRWFYNYSGGQLTNFGVHFIDIIRWFLDLGTPKSVAAMGGKYTDLQDNREIPDTMQVMWEFDPSVLVTFTQSNGNGASGDLKNSEIEFRGTKGTMYVRNSSWEVVPEGLSDTVTGYEGGRGYGNPTYREGASKGKKKASIQPRVGKGTASYNTESHTRNFLDCIKSRGKCNADILIGHTSTATTLIGNIAHKTRHMLEWDGKAERFPSYAPANQYLSYKYRPPYKLG
jgi:predicted dehydrogenase